MPLADLGGRPWRVTPWIWTISFSISRHWHNIELPSKENRRPTKKGLYPLLVFSVHNICDISVRKLPKNDLHLIEATFSYERDKFTPAILLHSILY